MNNSFNMIFKKYSNLVYYVSFDILRNEEEAKDIVNEAFLKMYDKRRDFTSESKLKYFLLVVAKNLAINRYNELKNKSPYVEEMSLSEDNIGISFYLDKFKEILDKEEFNYLFLHIIYGFTFLEIARANNLSLSQVSSKYRRGLIKLRKYYKEKK